MARLTARLKRVADGGMTAAERHALDTSIVESLEELAGFVDSLAAAVEEGTTLAAEFATCIGLDVYDRAASRIALRDALTPEQRTAARPSVTWPRGRATGAVSSRPGRPIGNPTLEGIAGNVWQ